CIQIDVNVAGQLPVFVADHGWSTRERNFSYLLDWDLCTRWCSNQHAAQFIYVVAKIALVTNAHGITFAAFDVFGDIHAADAGGDGLLDISNGQAVFRRLGTVHINIYIKALRNMFRKDRSHLRKRSEEHTS